MRRWALWALPAAGVVFGVGVLSRGAFVAATIEVGVRALSGSMPAHPPRSR